MKESKKKKLIIRPPVVTVMGHVDHGKSSLLCAIKDFKITEGESGGITQHIGAYEIKHQGKEITFIDTPGHEAFSAMRSRGARVADIAILVVAGEEGVKPQTKEVISHVKKYSIPLIIAINKMDKPQADPAKVKRELAQCDILTESEGGEIPCVEVSAQTKKGIPDLLDLILLMAEMEELKVDLSQSLQGIIIESYLDNQRGPIATLLSKQGVLKLGDVIGTSSAFGKVKILEDFQGKQIKEALPSMPAIVLGFESVPVVGEEVKVFLNIETAQGNIKKSEKKIELSPAEPGEKAINLILKVDVLGSLEAIEGMIENLPQEEIKLRIVKSGVGEITEEDLKMTQLTKAKIIGFRVKANARALRFAQIQRIKIRAFDVIYGLVEEIRVLMEKALKPQQGFKETGRVRALAIFRTEKNRQIVGGKVLEGEVTKGTRIDVLSNEEKIGQGKLINLQRNKKPIEKASKGEECGILFEGDVKVKEDDILVIKTYG